MGLGPRPPADEGERRVPVGQIGQHDGRRAARRLGAIDGAVRFFRAGDEREIPQPPDFRRGHIQLVIGGIGHNAQRHLPVAEPVIKIEGAIQSIFGIQLRPADKRVRRRLRGEHGGLQIVGIVLAAVLIEELVKHRDTGGNPQTAGGIAEPLGKGLLNADLQVVLLQHRNRGVKIVPGFGRLQAKLLQNIPAIEHHVEVLRLRNAIHAALVPVRDPGGGIEPVRHGLVAVQLGKIFQRAPHGQIDNHVLGGKEGHVGPLARHGGLHQNRLGQS